MTEREELATLIIQAMIEAPESVDFAEFLADYLYERGVRRINIGDTAFVIRTDTKEAVQGTISHIGKDCKPEIWVEI